MMDRLGRLVVQRQIYAASLVEEAKAAEPSNLLKTIMPFSIKESTKEV